MSYQILTALPAPSSAPPKKQQPVPALRTTRSLHSSLQRTDQKHSAMTPQSQERCEADKTASEGAQHLHTSPEDIPLAQLKERRAASNAPRKEAPMMLTLTPRRNDMTVAEKDKMISIA